METLSLVSCTIPSPLVAPACTGEDELNSSAKSFTKLPPFLLATPINSSSSKNIITSSTSFQSTKLNEESSLQHFELEPIADETNNNNNSDVSLSAAGEHDRLGEIMFSVIIPTCKPQNDVNSPRLHPNNEPSSVATAAVTASVASNLQLTNTNNTIDERVLHQQSQQRVVFGNGVAITPSACGNNTSLSRHNSLFQSIASSMGRGSGYRLSRQTSVRESAASSINGSSANARRASGSAVISVNPPPNYSMVIPSSGGLPPPYMPRQGHPSLYASLASSTSSHSPMYFPNSGFRQLNPQQFRHVLLTPVRNTDSRPNMGDYYFDPMMPVELVISGKIPDEQFEKDIAYINDLVKKIRRARQSTRKMVIFADVLIVFLGSILTWLLMNPSVLVISVFVTLCSLIATDALSREYIKWRRWIETAQHNMAAVGWELIDFKFLASSFVERTDSIAIKITFLS